MVFQIVVEREGREKIYAFPDLGRLVAYIHRVQNQENSKTKLLYYITPKGKFRDIY